MRAPTAGSIAALLLAATADGAVAAPATKRCPDDRQARCGSVLVPLLRGAPDGGGQRLRIRFRVFPRRDRSRPALEPVLAAEGGPGYGSIDSAALYRFMLGPLGRRHDLIVVDNRGVGRSGAIDCPRLQALEGTYAVEVRRCARRLGRRANAYGTGAAADDLAAILDKLGCAAVASRPPAPISPTVPCDRACAACASWAIWRSAASSSGTGGR